jgi:hypothetical protein
MDWDNKHYEPKRLQCHKGHPEYWDTAMAGTQFVISESDKCDALAICQVNGPKPTHVQVARQMYCTT